ncbi:MAG: S9 family peptidase [Pyrinomonadaceae bacterium]|nr:S9 family peptidase [Pyrinomonadaceae bacterium]
MKARSFLSICLLLTVFCFTGFSQNTEKRPFTIDDTFKIKNVGAPVVSPDGKWIAFTVREADLKKDKTETRIWMVSSSGGEPIPMTSQGYSAGSPKWSPDGKYLSFIASKSKEERPQVWALNRNGGEANKLTKVKHGVSGHEWSPDSKRLLLYIRDPKPHELTETKEDDKKPRPYVIDRLQFKRDYAGYLNRFRTHLYVFDVGSAGEPRQITSGDYDDGQAVWSPDGKSIAFVSNRTKEPDGNPNTDIWVVSADNGDKGATLLQITKNKREDNSPRWSPDGKSIAYTTVTAPLKTMWYATNKLAVISANGGAPRILAPNLDRNIRQHRFSNDGKEIWFQLEDSGERHLASMPVSGGPIKRHVRGKNALRSFNSNGSTTALLISRKEIPGEIFTFGSSGLKQITNINTKFLSGINLAETETIQYKSKDGTEIEAFLTKPVGFNPSMRYPLILNPHGGPVSQYDHGFNIWSQIYAANGYLVLQPNPRGSSGYGQAFSYALFADWGNLDFQDVEAGVDFVIARGYADPNKLGVGGWSYGGILTNYVITQTTRYKGAVSGASEALYRANYGHDHYQLWWEIELGLPWENAEAWERISPFNNVGKITTPTLWIGGAVDWNVPILNSEQMYQAMKRLGRETQLVVYPGEHHGIRRPTFQKDRFERFLGWFDKYVKGVKEAENRAQ